MKIFMLMRAVQKGGASHIFMWLAKSLADRGHQVSVMNYADIKEMEYASNVKLIYKPDLVKKGMLTIVKSVRQEIKKIDADVCISFLLDANVYNILACCGLKTKSIVCERNDPFKPGYWKLKLFYPLFGLADGAVHQLPKVADYYKNIKKYAVIPNPVFPPNDSSPIKEWGERENKISYFGRFDIFQKRNDVMIDAFAIFVKEFPQFKLYFYGRGEDEGKMRDQIKRLGIEDRIVFPGFTMNPEMELRNSKMYVLTSDFEGIPNTLKEAMSYGLPCISTDCRPGGASLLIEDGVNGFVVPKGDAKAVADKMIYFASNPESADKMGKEAIKIIDKFSEEKTINAWESFIKSYVR